MTNLPNDSEGSQSIESSIPSYVTMPGSLSYFAIAYQQWDQLRSQISRIDSNESLWFTASLTFLAFSVSFFINIILPGSSEAWVGTILWTGTAAGLVGAILCFIAYRTNRSQRESDIEAILNYMDEIKQTYRE